MRHNNFGEVVVEYGWDSIVFALICIGILLVLFVDFGETRRGVSATS